MDSKKAFSKYYKRLALQGVVKALICGAIVGFAASIVSALAVVLINITYFWQPIPVSTGLIISVAVFCIFTSVSTAVFYRLFFKPNTKQIAERVDRLGYDERFITMMELENDSSYIAMLQREDAKNKIKSIESKRLRFSLFKVFKVPLIAFALVAACFTLTVIGAAITVQTMDGWSPSEPRQGSNRGGESFMVSYGWVFGGFVYGENEQIILRGLSATTVVAVAHEGWIFLQWSDGVRSPERTDRNISRDMEVVAVFEPEGPPIPMPDDGDDPMDQEEFRERNFIIDGEVYYRDVYWYFYEQAMRLLVEGREIPDWLRNIVQRYFAAIV